MIQTGDDIVTLARNILETCEVPSSKTALTDFVTSTGYALVPCITAPVEVVLASLAVGAGRVLTTVQTVAAMARTAIQLLVKITTVRQLVTVTGCGEKKIKVVNKFSSRQWLPWPLWPYSFSRK